MAEHRKIPSVRFVLVALAAINTPTAIASTTPLPAPVAQVARAFKVTESAVSVRVQRIVDTAPRVAFDADTPRNPASVMKLVTPFAALETLGPAYTWKTEVHLGQPLRPDGSTDEVGVRGGGDPFLVIEAHWKMLAALRERGLSRIDRRLVVHVSCFDRPAEDRAAFDGQPDRVQDQLPHPLLLNFNAVRLRIQARPEGGVTAASGQRYLAVALVNAPEADRRLGEELQGAMLQWVYEQR